MDRISELPDFIIHHIILSFLNTRDAPPAELIRMSVLSKTWFHLTASFPFLDFYMGDFTSRESFFKYVEYTTSRFCHQDVTAHRLRLGATIQEPAELDIVNRCLELLLKKGVNVLVIGITNISAMPMPKYRLPNTLLSVSMLKYLSIRGCELPSSLMLDVVMFKSLIHLKLQDVQIDDEEIKRLTTSCPLLHVLSIQNCHGFKRFCVYRHQNLREVWIYGNTQVERIDIEAPNLSFLFIVHLDGTGRGAPQMNLASCGKLTTVTYIGHSLPNSNGFTDFLSNFPFVESLFLATAYKCNNLKLSSHSLRTLMLHPSCDFEEVDLSTPNLVLLGYPCNPRCFLPIVRHSTHLKGCMLCYPDGYIDNLWFQKLRLFLDKKNGFKVFNLYIHALYSQALDELEELQEIESTPYELEHVELQLESDVDPLAHILFVEAVLWCCRPRSLTLISSFPSIDFEEHNDVFRCTHEKLLKQEDKGHTSIQIVPPSSSYTSLSMAALPREGKAISFIKEKVLQEKADSQRFAGLKIF